jgi:glutathione S-transferase
VLVDDNLRIIESLAILDYLEFKYPEVSLLPNDAATLGKVKMTQMVTNSELGSLVIPLVFNDVESIKLSQAKRHLKRVCKFLSELLGDELYFGGSQFTIGDVVAGNGLILVSKLGFELNQFSNIEAYCQRLMEREVWQKTQPNEEQIALWKEVVTTLFNKRNKPHPRPLSYEERGELVGWVIPTLWFKKEK